MKNQKNLQERKEKAQAIIHNFAKSISNIILDQNVSDAIDLIIQCRENKGKIVTTGMGKAGIAMRKFSSTLCSLGFSSCYLHPGESSHGDLGVISDNDILFVASTSGKTREIIEIMHLAKNINVKKIIGITSHEDSPIRDEANVIIDMGEINEEGHLELAPTTSILVMTAITDSIALIASEEIGFSAKDFGKYHHSGYLGELARQSS